MEKRVLFGLGQGLDLFHYTEGEAFEYPNAVLLRNAQLDELNLPKAFIRLALEESIVPLVADGKKSMANVKELCKVLSKAMEDGLAKMRDEEVVEVLKAACEDVISICSAVIALCSDDCAPLDELAEQKSNENKQVVVQAASFSSYWREKIKDMRVCSMAKKVHGPEIEKAVASLKTATWPVVLDWVTRWPVWIDCLPEGLLLSGTGEISRG